MTYHRGFSKHLLFSSGEEEMGLNLKNICFVIIALLLSACGGSDGGDSSSTTPTTPTSSLTILGTVTGTTIIAIDENDDVVASDDTADKTPNADGSFSFTLTELPLSQDIRIFLITDGAIYPMYFDTNGDGDSDTNVFALNSDASSTLELGFIAINVTGEDGRAIPEFDPTNDSNVVAGAAIAEIPPSVNEPVTSGLSVAELNAAGLKAFSDGWVLGARAYFKEAVSLVGNDTSSDADTARFFFALSRVAALGFDTLSDGEEAPLDRLADVLDRLGVLNDEKRGNLSLIELPEPLPSNSPTGNEYRDFLYNVASPELSGAMDDLAKVSSSFNIKWLVPFLNDGEKESDYGDVLFFRSSFGSALAAIAIQRAYDLEADIDEIAAANKDNTDQIANITIESFLDTHADFLKLTDLSKLAVAKAALDKNALADIDEAIVIMLAETDDQSDDLISLADLSAQEITDFRTDIANVQSSIDNGPTDFDSSLTLDLKQFFDAGVDFRTPNRLPAFTGDDISGLFPDPNFNDVVLSPDLNEDVVDADGVPGADGIPDIVQ